MQLPSPLFLLRPAQGRLRVHPSRRGGLRHLHGQGRVAEPLCAHDQQAPVSGYNWGLQVVYSTNLSRTTNLWSYCRGVVDYLETPKCFVGESLSISRINVLLPNQCWHHYIATPTAILPLVVVSDEVKTWVALRGGGCLFSPF